MYVVINKERENSFDGYKSTVGKKINNYVT